MSKNKATAVKGNKVETSAQEQVNLESQEQVQEKTQAEKIKEILGLDVNQLTPEQKKLLRESLTSTGKTSAIETLTNTARNHRAKLENNLFDLKQMGCPQEILDEIMQPLQPIQCKTRTMARLKKEAEAKAQETPAEASPANETEGSEASIEA